MVQDPIFVDTAGRAAGEAALEFPSILEDGRVLFYSRDRAEFGFLSHFRLADRDRWCGPADGGAVLPVAKVARPAILQGDPRLPDAERGQASCDVSGSWFAG